MGGSCTVTPARSAAMWGETGSGSSTGLSSCGGTTRVEAARSARLSSLAQPPWPSGSAPDATGFMPTTRRWCRARVCSRAQLDRVLPTPVSVPVTKQAIMVGAPDQCFFRWVVVLAAGAGSSPRRASDFLVCDKKITKEARLSTAVRRNSLRACGATLTQPPEIRRTSRQCATLARAREALCCFTCACCIAVLVLPADPPQQRCETGLPSSP